MSSVKMALLLSWKYVSLLWSKGCFFGVLSGLSDVSGWISVECGDLSVVADGVSVMDVACLLWMVACL